MPGRNLVLIIEDAAEIADIFAEILQGNGMTTEVITDGAAASRALRERTPALVLLDMHLPNISGAQLLEEIKANPQLKKTKVIAITADALLAATLEDKVELVLVKPVSFDQISNLSSRLLS